MVTSTPGVDPLLSKARAVLLRLEARDAHRAQRDGALLVDIRPIAQRRDHGEIPEALVVERNVLEWRFDPRGDARLPVADRPDLEIILCCQEGYASSLAAAALREVGQRRVTDVVGGFAAWRRAGLPVAPLAVPSRDPVHPGS